MERTATLGGNLTSGNQLTNPVNSAVEAAAQTAHKTTDKIADNAAVRVDRSAAAVHRAVDVAADAATSTATWASETFEQAQQVKTHFTEAASASIRARPIATVVGVLIVGYLLGRLARL
ncbi:MAG TPA: hypothetical protein VG425_03510 [Casimicrobiaceae bacterium]|jgi:hypothetical protein|nr:hypothetical protein [Casimicrobiaceae bacterium]